MRILLSGGTICTFDAQRRCIRNGYLGIDDNRIAFVSKSPPNDFNPDRVVDCEGCLVLPGFVNCHTHLAENLFKGLMEETDFEGLFYTTLFRWEALLDPEMVYWGSMAGILDALRCGVTTVSDMYHHASATTEAIAAVGIRGYIGQKILGFPPEKPPRQIGQRIDYGFDFSAFIAQLEDAVHFALTWNGMADGRITTSLAPHATNTLNRSMFTEIAKRAAEEKLGVHLHLAQMESERETILAREQMGCVEFLEDVGLLELPILGAHAIFVTEEEIKILRRYNVAIAHNPVPNARDAAAVAPVTEMQRQGVTVGLGTDAFEMNMLDTARFAALINRVHNGQPDCLPAYEALELATIGGARALRLDHEIGTLELGKKADVVVFDMSGFNVRPARDPVKNLVYYGDVRDIRMVIVDGRVLFEKGKFTTVDMESVAREFDRVCRKLEERLKQF